MTTSEGRAVTDGGNPDLLDRLAITLAARSGVRFEIATTDAARAMAYRLRRDAVSEKQWSSDAGSSIERDEFDDTAVQLIGGRDGAVVCCGRLVLPPGPLPTEVACGIVVQPAGQVVDVGRMVLAPIARGPDKTIFVALLAALYLETRRRGFTTGCGMMAANARVLMRHLGIGLDVLGRDRPYWGVQRAPVRFDVSLHGSAVLERWVTGEVRSAETGDRSGRSQDEASI
jgi:N-acyl-L-homoserine lactone synthetase